MDFKQNIKPKKALGQNFLTEISVIKKLIVAADIKIGETVLEIGPGTGNLTEQLLKTGNKIIAVEKDNELAIIIQKKFDKDSNFKIIIGDALKYDETIITPPYKIAANLPFYLTAPLIRKFLESQNPPLAVAVIVQKEVAQRICSQPPNMNLLAASVQFYAAPKIISYISKGAFWPVPKVDCAILQITPYIKEGDRADKKFIANFFKIVKAGFCHPRKQLIGNLSNGLGLDKNEIAVWLAKNDIALNCRAQILTIGNWISIAKAFEL